MTQPRIRQVVDCETGNVTYEEITGVELINLEFQARQMQGQEEQIAFKISQKDSAREKLLRAARVGGPDSSIQSLAQAMCDYLGIEPDTEPVHEES